MKVLRNLTVPARADRYVGFRNTKRFVVAKARKNLPVNEPVATADFIFGNSGLTFEGLDGMASAILGPKGA